MAQLTAASSPVVQRHAPWIWLARACSLWCEAFAPHTANSQRETRACVPLHQLNWYAVLCCDAFACGWVWLGAGIGWVWVGGDVIGCTSLWLCVVWVWSDVVGCGRMCLAVQCFVVHHQV